MKVYENLGCFSEYFYLSQYKVLKKLCLKYFFDMPMKMLLKKQCNYTNNVSWEKKFLLRYLHFSQFNMVITDKGNSHQKSTLIEFFQVLFSKSFYIQNK